MYPVHTFKAGTVASRYELVGIIDRTTFGELLFSTGALAHLCELIGESDSQGRLHICRYTEFLLVKPGQRRPIKFKSIPETWFSNNLVDQRKLIDELLEVEAEAEEEWLPYLVERLDEQIRKRFATAMNT